MSSADLWALLPLLILTLGATALLLVGVWWPRYSALLLAASAIALVALLAAGVVTPTVGAVGGLLGVGPFGRFGMILFALLAAMTLLLSLRYGRMRRFSGGEYGALLLFAAAGMGLLAGATSLIGIFLGLESLTLALYILIAFDKHGPDGAEAGLKYLILGAVATGILAFGIALIYLSSGSFHLPEALAGLNGTSPFPKIALLGWGLFFAAVAFKLSLVPFHLWTPDVYQGSPAPISGLLATGSKGAVVVALVGLSSGLNPGWGPLAPLLLGLASLTLIIGPFAALAQQNVKRMLAYSSVVHMGFTFVALSVGGPAGRSATLFYVCAYGIATLGAFGVLACLTPEGGEEVQNYDALLGAGYRRPWHSAALTLFLLSLAGIPATAGFVAKFGVLLAALRAGQTWLALIGVFAALISIYYYLRLITTLYMTGEGETPLGSGDSAAHGVLLFCVVTVLFLGLWPGPLLELLVGILR